jgi:hypothetical protein
MLEAVLAAEIQAGKDYTQRAKEADEYGDKGLAVQLEDMVRETPRKANACSETGRRESNSPRRRVAIFCDLCHLKSPLMTT